MFSKQRNWFLVLMLVGGLWTVPVRADVQDHAGLFSKSAVSEANQIDDRMMREYKHQVTVETFKEIPADRKANFDEKSKTSFFKEWATQRARDQHVEGVYVLICSNPKHLQTEVGNQTRRVFSEKNQDELSKILIKDLKNNPDSALVNAVRFVDSTFASNWGKVQDAPRRSTTIRHTTTEGGSSMVPYIIFGILGILGLWMLVGLFRGMSGGMAGGPGMGYGAAPGGGGFMSSLLGGMFGAAAGMWMYDSMFGRGSSSAWGAGNNNYGDSGNTGIGDDTDYSSGNDGGGDWGGDNTGDNTGGNAGGGDWGGGDWGGGGGDWGGGGGDFGGGGGDW